MDTRWSRQLPDKRRQWRLGSMFSSVAAQSADLQSRNNMQLAVNICADKRSAGTPMECPKCRLLNPPNAIRCDCGWDFTSNTMRESYLTPTRTSPSRAGFGGIDMMGWASLVIGALASIVGTSVLVAPDVDESIRAQGATKSLIFAALAIAYGLALIKRKKVALRRGWSLLPILGAGLTTPAGLAGIALIFWFTQRARKRADLFT
jgi:hypothetical protein